MVESAPCCCVFYGTTYAKLVKTIVLSFASVKKKAGKPRSISGTDSGAGGPNSSGHFAVPLAAPSFCRQAGYNYTHNKARLRWIGQCWWHVSQALAAEAAVGAGLAELEACAPFVC